MENIHSLKENDKILLELHSNRKIECNFKSATKSGIIVRNSLDLITKKQRKNQQHFYRSEIKSIVPNRISNDIGNSAAQESKKQKPKPSLNKKVFNQTAIDQIQKLASTVIYITQCDSQYFAAIEDLKYQEHIVIYAEHVRGRMMNKRPFISICTANSVYAFDILCMGKFPEELQTILESEQPRKIIFDSSLMTDYLKHVEHCELNGVLDVLVFHLMVKRIIKPTTFEECLREYFDVEDYIATDSTNYEQRPLTKESIQLAAHKVILLMKLFWHLIHDILLLPLMIESENFTTSFSDLPYQVDVLGYVNIGENPGIENIDINGLDHFDSACLVHK